MTKDNADLIKMQRGIYLLPNLLTTAALFFGFYSILSSMKGRYEPAIIAIFVALIADCLDGRVARLTNTQSAFGAQYDSLSDMVAFGLAPAILLFTWSLFSLGKVGWMISFLFTAGTALRLARFNTQQIDKKYFQGLPCPAAAALMASFVWILFDYDVSGVTLGFLIAVMTFLVASLMVSSIRYSSFKSVDLKGKVRFITSVMIVVIAAAIALSPPQILFFIFLIYAASGPIVTLWQIRKLRRQRHFTTTRGS